MRLLLSLVKFILVGTLLLSFSPSLAQDPALVKHFDYDRSAPLAVKEIGVERRGDASVHDITYASQKGGVVPAYLVVPKGKGPFAAVLWGHWCQGGSALRNRKQFLDEAVVLASSGVVSLLPDHVIVRPGYVPNNEPLNEQQITDLLQQVTDMRRGIDLLTQRKDVDRNRIAYVGHSCNAVTGAFLSGVDRRFKSLVLMAATMSDEVSMQTPEYKEFRQKAGPEKFDAFVARYSWTDQGKYVSHAAPAVVFLQYATKERFITPERARLYAAVVSEPKRFKLYDAPHALNAEATRDRIAFLIEQLKLKPIPDAKIATIPELVQPPSQN